MPAPSAAPRPAEKPRAAEEVSQSPPPLTSNRQTRSDRFTELIESRQRGLGLAALALVVAAGLGAFHALEPGHGKTIVAAYLVGARGTGRHAVILGCIVTASHTMGVYALGLVTLYASRYVLPERLYPWLGILSGATIAALGLALFWRRFAGSAIGTSDALADSHAHAHGNHVHAHSHVAHGHPHTHGHSHPGARTLVEDGSPHSDAVGHAHLEAAEGRDEPHHHGPIGHGHTHVPAGERVSLRELFALGITGGIVPCPAALVVLLSALSLGRVGFGLLLIAAFSVGLAAVLVAIGLLMVYARRFMSRMRGDGPIVTRWLPLTSAAVMTVLGIAIALQALATAVKL